MTTNKQAVNITFPKEESDLYQWTLQKSRAKPVAWVGREALDCLRFCERLFGDRWREELEALMDVARMI